MSNCEKCNGRGRLIVAYTPEELRSLATNQRIISVTHYERSCPCMTLVRPEPPPVVYHVKCDWCGATASYGPPSHKPPEPWTRRDWDDDTWTACSQVCGEELGSVLKAAYEARDKAFVETFDALREAGMRKPRGGSDAALKDWAGRPEA